MTLSMKSTLSGLAKLTGTEPPDTLELEDIAQQAFARADKNADGMITFEEYEDYCLHNPEVRSWIHYFDDPEEDLEDEDLPVDSDLELECNVRSPFHSVLVWATNRPPPTPPPQQALTHAHTHTHILARPGTGA